MAFDNNQLTIEIAARNLAGPAFAQVQQQLERLNQSAQQSAQGTSRLESMIGTLRAGLAALPIAMVIDKLSQFHDATVQLAVRINDQSEALGLNTRQYQALQVAAAGAGIEESKAAAAVAALNVKIGEAVRGKKDAIDAFEALGVKILDVNGKQRAEMAILEEVALKLSRVEDTAKRSALAKDIFGQSGARLTALMKTLADGLERTAAEAERSGQIMDEKTVKALERLDHAGNQTGRQLKILYAQLAAPVITEGLETFTKHLIYIKQVMREVGALWDRITGGSAAGNPAQLTDEIARLQADRDRIAGQRVFGAGVSTQRAQLMDLDTQIAQARARLAMATRPPTSVGFGGPEPDAGSVSLTGARNPAVVGGGGGGTDRAADALASLQTQIREVNEAYLTLRTTTTETAKDSIAAAELHLRIETQLANTLRGIPADDPRREQIIARTRELEGLRQRYDTFRQAIQFADQTQARFGDGTREHANTMRMLNEALVTGRLTQDAYAAAVRSANEALAAQKDRAAEAQGGIQGFGAGFASALRQYEKSNSTFRMGADVFTGSMNIMNNSLRMFRETGEFSFKSLAISFADMLSDMATRWAMSEIFRSLTSSGGGGMGGGGGLFGSLFSGLFSGQSGAGAFGGVGSAMDFGSLMGGSGMGMGGLAGVFAEGGRPPVGRPSLVGERGPELFVPDMAGTVIPNRALGDGGGVHVTVVQHFGESVNVASKEEVRAMERRLYAAIPNIVVDARRRGGSMRTTFAGA